MHSIKFEICQKTPIETLFSSTQPVHTVYLDLNRYKSLINYDSAKYKRMYTP